MKKLLAVIALTSLFVTGKTQTVDEIIDKHLAALGGKEKWLNLKTIIIEGNLKANGADVAVKIFGAHNKGTRQDITLGGMTGYDIVTPTEGWTFLPFQGQTKPEAKTADDLKNALDDLDLRRHLLSGFQVDNDAMLRPFEIEIADDGQAQAFRLPLNKALRA